MFPLTLTVKLLVPEPAGVPEITPVEEFRVSPAGSVPLETAHVYGVTPAAAARVAEYALPAEPPGSEVVSSWMLISCGPAGSDSAEYPAELIAQTVTLYRTLAVSPVTVIGLDVPVAW